MSRDFWRVCAVAAVVGVGWYMGEPPPPPRPGVPPALQAFLDAPDMGLHCFDDNGQPVQWQYVSPGNAWRWCGVTPQRLNELRSTDWQAVAAAKERKGFEALTVWAGAGYLVLGIWLLRKAKISTEWAGEVLASADASHHAQEFWRTRQKADYLWLLAWLLALPAVFLLPDTRREGIVSVAGGATALCLFIVAPVWGLWAWLQERAEEREAKLDEAKRRDTREKLATGQAVTRASEEEKLGL